MLLFSLVLMGSECCWHKQQHLASFLALQISVYTKEKQENKIIASYIFDKYYPEVHVQSQHPIDVQHLCPINMLKPGLIVSQAEKRNRKLELSLIKSIMMLW